MAPSAPSAPTALEVVLGYHRAWTGGDVAHAMTYLAEDITCQAPGRSFDGREDWRAFLTGFAPTLTGLVDVAHFVDGSQVALFYHPQTAATSTALAAERFTVHGSEITELAVVFDRLSYAPPDQP